MSRAPDPADRRRSPLTIDQAGSNVPHSGRAAIPDRLAVARGKPFSDDEAAVLAAEAALPERLARRF